MYVSVYECMYVSVYECIHVSVYECMYIISRADHILSTRKHHRVSKKRLKGSDLQDKRNSDKVFKSETNVIKMHDRTTHCHRPTKYLKTYERSEPV